MSRMPVQVIDDIIFKLENEEEEEDTKGINEKIGFFQKRSILIEGEKEIISNTKKGGMKKQISKTPNKFPSVKAEFMIKGPAEGKKTHPSKNVITPRSVDKKAFK